MEHMLDKDVERVLFSEEELHRRVAEIAAEIETLQDEIKAEMTTRNTDTLQADIFTVRWTTVKSSRLDSKALKAEQPELYARYTKTTETRRFTVA